MAEKIFIMLIFLREFISYLFEVENGVTTTPKRRFLLSLFFACLCIKKPLFIRILRSVSKTLMSFIALSIIAPFWRFYHHSVLYYFLLLSVNVVCKEYCFHSQEVVTLKAYFRRPMVGYGMKIERMS